MESNDIYLSNLEVLKDDAERVYVKLAHYNHLDYIEDVLVEQFDFESFCTTRDEPHSICVYEESEFGRFYKIIDQINLGHSSTNELYKTV